MRAGRRVEWGSRDVRDVCRWQRGVIISNYIHKVSNRGRARGRDTNQVRLISAAINPAATVIAHQLSRHRSSGK